MYHVQGVIGAPDQGARSDFEKSEFQGCFAVTLKLFRCNITVQRIGFGGRRKILPDGKEVAVRIPEVTEGLKQFRFGFSQADHDSRFAFYGIIHALDRLEQFERAPVISAGPDGGIEARDRFNIVVQDVGPGLHYRPEGLL
jgi:hypothetical protein